MKKHRRFFKIMALARFLSLCTEKSQPNAWNFSLLVPGRAPPKNRFQIRILCKILF